MDYLMFIYLILLDIILYLFVKYMYKEYKYWRTSEVAVNKVLILTIRPTDDIEYLLPLISCSSRHTELYIYCMTSGLENGSYRTSNELNHVRKILGLKRIFIVNHIYENCSDHIYNDYINSINYVDLKSIEKNYYLFNLLKIVNKYKIKSILYLNYEKQHETNLKTVESLYMNYIRILRELLGFLHYFNILPDKSSIQNSYYKILTNKYLNNNVLSKLELFGVEVNNFNNYSVTVQMFDMVNEFMFNTICSIDLVFYTKVFYWYSSISFTNFLYMLSKINFYNKIERIPIKKDDKDYQHIHKGLEKA